MSFTLLASARPTLEVIFLAILGADMEHPVTAAERILLKLTDFVN